MLRNMARSPTGETQRFETQTAGIGKSLENTNTNLFVVGRVTVEERMSVIARPRNPQVAGASRRIRAVSRPGHYFNDLAKKERSIWKTLTPPQRKRP